ncbi:MAG: hypothetical protein ABI878_14325 [Acidobacteriota bacterium]
MKKDQGIRVKEIIAGIAAFALLILLAVGCNLSRFTRSGNTQVPGTTDNRGSGTTRSASGQCDNTYYPVGPNVTRKYHVSYPKGLLSDRDYTESFTDFSGDTFTVNTDFGTVAAHVKWRCMSEGLLATQYNNSIDVKNSGTSVAVETTDSKGVTFPNPDKWTPGSTWTAEYHIIENINTSSGKSIGGSKGTVTQDGEVVGPDEVTVPAGTFQAVKIKITTKLDLIMNIPGANGMPITTKVETTAWMVKDTGMVKSVTNIAGSGDTTSEMTSINK